MMKYILVTGGVISGIGKGVISSSLGTILRACKVRVTAIKIDPYINIDAGTFSPYEHGEVFVLDDGGEVDLDLGNYERFMDITLHRDNNITTGKIYQHVISKERRGDYLGKTVQVVPHITDAIQEWVERVAKISVDGTDQDPECCIIELGGTIGDIEGMPFVEAFRQFQFHVGKENFCNVHVSLIPQPNGKNEQKTKPTQNGVRELRGLGLSPDIIMCRSAWPLTKEAQEKISHFCHVPVHQVLSVQDVSSIYSVPPLLQDQNIISFFADRLNMKKLLDLEPCKLLSAWRDLSERHENFQKEVQIALVGKYTKLEDAYASVIKALTHSAMSVNRRLKLRYIEASNLEDSVKMSDPVRYHDSWQNLCGSDGVLVPGGFGQRGLGGKIEAIKWARKHKLPFLGVCLGMQCAVIEFARSVLDLPDAHTTEAEANTCDPVIIDMPEHNPGQLGGTMRLGQRVSHFKAGTSILKMLYGDVDSVTERHRHRYEVNPVYVDKLEAAGLKFIAHDETRERMEMLELEGHPYFVAVQFHPEYLSRPLNPAPPYLGLLLASVDKLQAHLNKMKR